MNFFQLILWPFTTIITKTFDFSYVLTGNYGISLIIVSLFITLITAPLYLLADKWKTEETLLKNKMAEDIEDIKTHYTGNKSYYLIKTTHKLFGYSGLHALKTSFGLILQIPFFFGAYEALTHYKGYKGHGFLFITDLSMPDNLLFGFALFPFIMTLVNILSAAYYTKTFSIKQNQSLYIMSLIFFVLLYKSPSALLIYWTMNNVFSIAKTFLLRKLNMLKDPIMPIIIKTNKPSYLKQFIIFSKGNPVLVVIFLYVLAISLTIFFGFQTQCPLIFKAITILVAISTMFWLSHSLLKKEFKAFMLIGICAILTLLTILPFIYATKLGFKKSNPNIRLLPSLLGITANFIYPFIIARRKSNWLNGPPIITNFNALSLVVFLTFLLFVYQPLMIFLSDPQAIGISFMLFITNSILMCFITVTLFLVLLKLAKKHFNYLIIILTTFILSSLFYLFFFQPNVGMINGLTLQNVDAIEKMSSFRHIFDALLITFFILISYYILKKHILFFNTILVCFMIIWTVQLSIKIYDYQGIPQTSLNKATLPKTAHKNHQFSKTENNVIYLIADMFNGNYLRRMLQENPDYLKKLDGFEYYPDCLSIGNSTAVSLPALHAGPDYLAHKLNNNNLTGKEEHHASLDFLFNEVHNNNYAVTIIGYLQLSNYSKSTFAIENREDYVPHWLQKNGIDPKEIKSNYKHLPFMIALFNSSPWFMRNILYNNSSWLLYNKDFANIRKKTLYNLAHLDILPEISGTNGDKGLFLYLHNDLPHNPYGIDENGCLIQNSYPSKKYKNFDNKEAAYYSAKKALTATINMLNWLKENNIYDNTAVVIISDHGNSFSDNDVSESFMAQTKFDKADHRRGQSLFLVKGFNKRGELETKDALISSSDLYSYLYSIDVVSQKKEGYFVNKNQNNPRYYDVILGKWNRNLFEDNTPYRTYKVTGPLEEIKSWELME